MELKKFLKEQRKLNANKNENLLPQEFVDKLCNSPEEFFSDYKNQIQNLLSQNNKLFDSNQESIFEIFLELFRKADNEIYEKNFDEFFTELKEKINLLNRVNENFLIIYSKRKDKLFFIKLFIRLFNLGLLDENTVKQKNNNEETCYLILINDLLWNYEKISKTHSEEYKNFFKIFKENYPNLYKELNDENKIEIYKFLIDFNLDKLDLAKLSTKEINEKIDCIFKEDFDLIHNFLYMKNIYFNLLNYIIIKKDYENATVLLNKFKTLPNLLNYLDCLFDNLFYILKNEDKNEQFDNYLQNLIEIILPFFENENDKKKIEYLKD